MKYQFMLISSLSHFNFDLYSTILKDESEGTNNMIYIVVCSRHDYNCETIRSDINHNLNSSSVRPIMVSYKLSSSCDCPLPKVDGAPLISEKEFN